MLTNRKAIEFVEKQKVLDSITGGKLVYYLDKNHETLKIAVKGIKKKEPKLEAYTEFENARMDVIKEHAILDTQGNPKMKIVGPNQYEFELDDAPERMKEFNNKIQKLNKKYQQAIDEFDKLTQKWEEFLDKPITDAVFKDIRKMSESEYIAEYGDQQITKKQFNLFSFMITEENADK